MQAMVFVFFLHCAQCFTYPLPLQLYFPPHFFLIPSSTILLFCFLNVFIPSSTIFIILPPQCFYSLLHNFCYFPSSTSSFILYIFPFTNTSTSYRPHIDPSSTLHRPHIDPTSTSFAISHYFRFKGPTRCR